MFSNMLYSMCTLLPQLCPNVEQCNSPWLTYNYTGWVGVGKSFVSSIVANHLFQRGMKSEFVNHFMCDHDFPYSDEHNIENYKNQLRSWITGNVSRCERTVFIFEEVDKMNAGVLDAILPFLEHNEPGKNRADYRKSIFIFISYVNEIQLQLLLFSNKGGKEIMERTIQQYKEGKPRETITLFEMEKNIKEAAFNDIGGLHKCDLIRRRLISHFIPFLPLEREHVRLCIHDNLKSKGIYPEPDVVKKIADTLEFYEPDEVFASAGCKGVDEKADLPIYEHDEF